MGASVQLKSNVDDAIRKIKETVVERMHEAVNEVRKEVLDTLTGDRSGRQYRVPGTGRIYTASAPGEPPAQRQGELRQSVATTVGGEGKKVVGKVGSDKPYARQLEFGTKGGRVIHAKPGKVLAFEVNGKKVFTKSVRQGPIAPRPWLRPSFERTTERIKRIFNRKWL